MPADVVRRDPRLPYRELDADFLAPRDPLLGYIKIGGKSPDVRYSRAGKPWVAPIRLLDPARFEVTTREKRTKRMKGQGNAKGETFTVDLGYVRDQEFHDLEGVGDKPSRLRVRLLYPTVRQNLIAFLGAYGREWVCRGNGVEAIDIKRGTVTCPCPRLVQFTGKYEGPPPNDGNKLIPCKPHGQLNVLLEDAEVFGGFHALKTTSYGTISNLIKSLQIFEDVFNRIDGIPLELRVMAVTMQVPGGATTVQPQVTLVLPQSMDGARQIAKSAADESRKYLPAGGELDETKYLAAVVGEMEAEAESYAGEFLEGQIPEGEVLEPEEVEPEGVVEGELRKTEALQEAQRAAEQLAAAAVAKMEEAEAELAAELERRAAENAEEESGDGPSVPAAHADRETDETPAPDDPQPEDEVEEPTREEDPDPDDDEPADDSDRNDPGPEAGEIELATKVLEAAGWDEGAIKGRLDYHEKTGTLDKLLQRLERGEPEAWAKVHEIDLFEGEPSDGLGE